MERAVKHRSGAEMLKHILAGLIFAIVFAFLFGIFMMLLWNWLMPTIFSLPELSYFEAVGVIVLSRLIFGSFGPHSHNEHSPRKSMNRQRDERWTDRWKYYHDFWNSEGEKSFNEYVQKRKNEE